MRVLVMSTTGCTAPLKRAAYYMREPCGHVQYFRECTSGYGLALSYEIAPGWDGRLYWSVEASIQWIRYGASYTFEEVYQDMKAAKEELLRKCYAAMEGYR